MQTQEIMGAKSPECPNVSKYLKTLKIGHGTFGEVFKAQDRRTKKFVALKKILTENESEGFPITALREVKILQKLKGQHIVEMLEICSEVSSTGIRHFHLVFEFCEHDLSGLLQNTTVLFTPAEIKMIMKQMLSGLFLIHSNKIIHRDIKASNILITKDGVLKIADFGLARAFSTVQKQRLTNRVVTLWYRPPELLLGARHYGTEIDMWGVGCLMAEMWIRSPLLPGQSEQEQLKMISQLCGSITTESFPGVDQLDLYNKIELPQGLKRKLKERLKPYIKNEQAVDLIDKFLILDPARRIDCDAALDDNYFWTTPMPSDLSTLLSKINMSMFELTSAQRRGQVPPPQRRTHADTEYRTRVY